MSDAGGETPEEPEPHGDWGRHAYRVLNIINSQVGALRKREVVRAFQEGAREGAYWGIRTDIADYGLPDALLCPSAAKIPTRLKALDAATQERIINAGYALCDAAMRKHVVQGTAAPGRLAYQTAV